MTSSTSRSKNCQEIKIFFVRPENTQPEQCSSIMKLAYQDCIQRNLSATWVSEVECDVAVESSTIVCYVLEKFQGTFFTKLRETKNPSVIVGPICLRTCLVENIEIPDNSAPVFTAAMRELHVTSSNLSESDKKRVKDLTRFMGGNYSNHLHEKCTHLVTNTVRSSKYAKAVEKGIHIMTLEWVNAVWEASLKENVLATDEQFLKYKCPIFHGLEITVSNLQRAEKQKISRLINDNGGTYNPQLSQMTASLLVVGKPEGEKFKHALCWNLPCVKPDWIYECIEKKYAVSTTNYLITAAMSSSTPTKNNPNFTHSSDPSLSGIGYTNNLLTVQNVNESASITVSENSSDVLHNHQTDPKTPNKTPEKSNAHTPVKTPVKTPIKTSYNYKTILSQLNVQDAKKAGGFLDGCKVYLNGFNANEEDVLRRILNAGGAIRYAELSDVVTHVVVGEFILENGQTIANLRTKPHVVTLDWIKDSLQQGCPASEENYLCSKINQAFAPLEAASPLAQRGLKMLQPEFRKPLPSKNVQGSPMSKRILRDYSNSSAGLREPDFPEREKCVEAPVSINVPDTQDELTISNLFEGLTFQCLNLENAIKEEVENDITQAGGKIASSRFSGVPDYAIVPVLISRPLTTSCEVVTYLWIKDCLDKCKILEVEFYHEPQIVQSLSKPLANCVLTSSNYVGQVRNFIRELGEGLGARVQEVFAKKDKGEAAASTHLICPSPDGHKFKASVKWKLPAVTIDWIVDCAKEGKKLPVDPYLVKPKDNSESSKPSPPKKLSASKSLFEKETATSSKRQQEDIADRTHIAGNYCLRPQNVNVADVSSNETQRSRMIAGGGEQNSVQSLGTLNSFDFNTPLANSTINPAQKRKSDSPLENTEGETSHQSGKTLTPDARKRWKQFPEFDSEKTLEPTQPRPARRPSASVSKLQSRICSTSDTSFAPPEEPSMSNSEVQTGFSSMDNSTSALRKVVDKAMQNINEKLPLIVSETGPQKMYPKRQVIVRKLPENSQLSDKPEVGWTDPVEVMQRERDKEQELLDRSSFIAVVPPITTKKFILSSITPNEKQLYQTWITELGGVVLTDALFSIEATHLITQTPIRSEKLLCSIARGLWVLHPKYIIQSKEAETFLEEEEYEWGNPKSLPIMPPLSTSSGSLLAKAAARWRQKIRDTEQLPFKGIRALIYVGSSKFEPVTRLLSVGGGEILTEGELSRVTHCFIETNNAVALNWAKYAEHHIYCLNILYLSEYLTLDPLPDPVKKLIPEYVPYYRQYLRSSR